MSMADPDDIEIDTEHITRHPPDTDIDQYVENCNFRIERMGSDGVWVCAYTHDEDEPDHHYDIYITDDGLHITHRAESD